MSKVNIKRRCPSHLADQVVNQILDAQSASETRKGLRKAAIAFAKSNPNPDDLDHVLFSVGVINRALKLIENDR